FLRQGALVRRGINGPVRVLSRRAEVVGINMARSHILLLFLRQGALVRRGINGPVRVLSRRAEVVGINMARPHILFLLCVVILRGRPHLAVYIASFGFCRFL
ncbi:hypothetical protein TcCL_ESM09795, partial [Trypanosoma cruzi]